MVKRPEDGNWVHLYRELLESKLWRLRPDDLKIAIFLLLKANYEKGKYVYEDGTSVDLEPGQLVASVEFIKKGVSGAIKGARLGTQQIRTCLKHLRNIHFLDIETNKRGNIITLLNYKEFQGRLNIANKPPDKGTNKPPTNPQQTPNNKGKKVKELKEIKKGSSGPEVPKKFHQKAKDLAVDTWERLSNRNGGPLIDIEYDADGKLIVTPGATWGKIMAWANGLSVEAVGEVIENYAAVVASPDTRWKYRWTFTEFWTHKNDLTRWLSKNKPLENFARNTERKPFTGVYEDPTEEIKL